MKKANIPYFKAIVLCTALLLTGIFVSCATKNALAGEAPAAVQRASKKATADLLKIAEAKAKAAEQKAAEAKKEVERLKAEAEAKARDKAMQEAQKREEARKKDEEAARKKLAEQKAKKAKNAVPVVVAKTEKPKGKKATPPPTPKPHKKAATAKPFYTASEPAPLPASIPNEPVVLTLPTNQQIGYCANADSLVQWFDYQVQCGTNETGQANVYLLTEPSGSVRMFYLPEAKLVAGKIYRWDGKSFRELAIK